MTLPGKQKTDNEIWGDSLGVFLVPKTVYYSTVYGKCRFEFLKIWVRTNYGIKIFKAENPFSSVCHTIECIEACCLVKTLRKIKLNCSSEVLQIHK